MINHEFTSPSSSNWNQCHGKKPNIVDPIYFFRHIFRNAEHVMMIVPSNSEKEKADGVGEQIGKLF